MALVLKDRVKTTTTATISVATRGVANILFVTGTTCVVTGNVS